MRGKKFNQRGDQNKSRGARNSGGRRPSGGSPERRSFGAGRDGDRRQDGEERFENAPRGGDRRKDGGNRFDKPQRGGDRRSGGEERFGNAPRGGDRRKDGEERFENAPRGGDRRSEGKDRFDGPKRDGDRKAPSREGRRSFSENKANRFFKEGDDKRFSRSGKEYAGKKNFAIPKTNTLDIRLNKYLAEAGICSRREADTLITAGAVEVNGKVVTELGFKVSKTDTVKYGGETLNLGKPVYYVLNKPKNFTCKPDPKFHRSVYDLVRHATKERMDPVGKLDRMTTGVLMLTNDGNMAKKLTHPRLKCRKIFHVTLTKPLQFEDLEKLKEGFEMKDGFSQCEAVEYVNGTDNKREIGIEIANNKPNIVVRLLEHLGYEAAKIDRVSYAGLTKKNLPRGRFRALTEQEVSFLRML